MNFELENNTLSFNLQDENKFDVTGEEHDEISSEGEVSFDQSHREIEENDDARVAVDKLEENADEEVHKTWKNVKNVFFDYEFVEVEREPENEEEEEEIVVDVDVSTINYDQSQYESLKNEERLEMLTKLRDMQEEYKYLLIRNKFLHRNYMNAIRNSPSASNALETFDDSLIYEDPRYQAALENFMQLRDNIDERSALLSSEFQKLEDNYSLAESNFKQIFENLVSQELDVSKKIRVLKMHKQTWSNQVNELLENQKRRLTDISNIRLTYIRWNTRLKILQEELEQYGYLGPGYSMLNYEDLLKRKDVYIQKCNEQYELIKKLSNKNLCCAAINRHIDEELYLYNSNISKEFESLSELLDSNRFDRSKTIKLRRIKNLIIKQIDVLKNKIGLLDKPKLCCKMESDIRKIEKLTTSSRKIKSDTSRPN